MTANEHDDDPRLLSVASSISSGTLVDWQSMVDDDDPDRTAIVDELRVLEGLTQLSDPAPSTWGPFTVVGELGRGAYGMVYRAIDPALQIGIALKVLRPRAAHPEWDAEDSLAEGRLLAQVNHEHVVRVYRAQRIGDEVGLAMELVKGQTLQDLVRLNGPFSADETLVIGAALCRAIAAVHRQQLLHGDIKAHNVMRAEGGRVVLMDFGAGKDLKAGPATTANGVTGTPMYMAPEVFAGAPRTHASDIYSLGVLMYYLATGIYPIEGQTRAEVQHHIRVRTPRRRLRDIRPDLPDRFIRVVERATAERPGDRYQSVGALEADLTSPHPAPVPSPPPMSWWRLAAGMAAVAAVSLGAYVVFTRPGAGTPPADTGAPAAATTATAAPVATAGVPGTYRIDAAFYRDGDSGPSRLDQGARVAIGDRLSLRIRSSVPTYLYVVNEDDQGDSFLLFPLPGQELTNPLPAGTRHELPGVIDGKSTSWTVTSLGGREHFLVFASPDPPTQVFQSFFASLSHADRGRSTTSHKLSQGEMVMLRGVGGLAPKPSASAAGGGLAKVLAKPLSGEEETVTGIWVRQLTLQNPVK